MRMTCSGLSPAPNLYSPARKGRPLAKSFTPMTKRRQSATTPASWSSRPMAVVWLPGSMTTVASALSGPGACQVL